MKLDLPTPGVPVSPTRSAGRAGGRQRGEQRPRRGAVVGAGRFDQRDRARQRPPVAGGDRAGQSPPASSSSRKLHRPVRFGPWPPAASLAYPEPACPALIARGRPCRASRACLALGLAPRPAGAGAPPSRRASTSTIAGIRVGALIDDVASSPASSYTAASRIDTAGHRRRSSPTSSSTAPPTGSVARDGTVVPATLRRRPRSRRGRCAQTEIDWKGGMPVSVSVEPPRKSAPDPAKQGGTLDPVSAGLRAVPRPRRPTSVCDTTRRRLRRLAPVAAEARRRRRRTATALVCAGTYARIEGEAHSLADRASSRSGWSSRRTATGSAGSSGSRRRPTSARRCSTRRG